MAYPLIALGIGLLTLAACSSEKEEDEGSVKKGTVTDGQKIDLGPTNRKEEEHKKEEDLCAPKKNYGDGIYSAKSGDVFKSDNGISFKLKGAKLPPYGDVLLAYAYLEDGKALNKWPYMLKQNDPNSFFLTDVHTISSSPSWNGKCSTMDISMSSVASGIIGSNKDLYKACLSMGKTHDDCSSFIPDEPGIGEYEMRDGIFRVYYKKEDAEVAGYYMDQLISCYSDWVGKHGITSDEEVVTLRVMSSLNALPEGSAVLAFRSSGQIYMRPNTVKKTGAITSVAQKGTCSDETVKHELVHLVGSAISVYTIPRGMLEGLAEFSSNDVKHLSVSHPYQKKELFVGESYSAANEAYGNVAIKVESIANGSVTVSLWGGEKFTFSEKQLWFYLADSGFIMAVDSVDKDKASFRFYKGLGAEKFPYYTKLDCGDSTYEAKLFSDIEGVAYELALPHELNGKYEHLDSQASGLSIYYSGHCFWREYEATCGEEAVGRFLNSGLEAYMSNPKESVFQFCWRDTLSSACDGNSLNKLTSKYGLDDAEPCEYLTHNRRRGDLDNCK